MMPQTGVVLKKKCLSMVEEQLASLLAVVQRGLTADFDLEGGVRIAPHSTL
jgi:hypothetical protein